MILFSRKCKPNEERHNKPQMANAFMFAPIIAVVIYHDTFLKSNLLLWKFGWMESRY